MPVCADQSSQIGRIVIVGGGVAGWMAAIYLNRYMRRIGGQVVLVEPPTLGTIGVGEATIPSLVNFLRQLDLDEPEFMRRCSATYKLGIRFDGWSGDGNSYWHPFGAARVNGLDLFHFWLKHRADAGAGLAYSDYSVHALLGEAEKSPWPYGGSSVIADAGSYAYHLEAAALGDYLREIAAREGALHLFGTVQNVLCDDHGNIASLDIGGGREMTGDLFLDATGGRLIEQALGDPWIDWSKFMLCDSAVAMPLPRGDRVPPYTLSKAMPAGWTWKIPLSSRTGYGYVFSRAHLSPEAAVQALVEQSGLRRARGADPRLIEFRVGRRTNFWLRNCVSIGQSSGFVEPLESTGIHLIQRAIMLLLDYLPDRRFSEALRTAYNSRMAALYDEVRDFIMLHYLLASRDEPFWRDAREAPAPETLRESLALYDEGGRIESTRLQLFTESSYFFILSGNRRLPRRPIVEADLARAGEIGHILDRVRRENHTFADRMPTHGTFLAELHRKRL